MKNLFFISSFLLLLAACSNNKETKTENNNQDYIVSEGIFTPTRIKLVPEIDGDIYKDQAAWDKDYFTNNNTSAMIKQLLDDALSGKINCYAECDTSTKLKAEEIKLRITPPADTLMIEDPNDPTGFVTKIVQKESLSERDICSLRFLESWNFNKNTGRIEKEIDWYGLEIAKFAEDGSFKGFAIPLYFKNPKK